ncbi:MAG: helix-hairpin-helix domain-containing protein [Pseudomonadota bacterium]|jgi:large subunit ribosomal protein L17|nr:helix-hairpin-helix domain-containing protein [Pseudomonadota bacterium]
MVRYFLLGLLVGWLVEWIIDWAWWRRRGDASGDGSGAVTGPAVGIAAGAAAPANDLTLVEGIGPKIASVLADAGIRSFADLAVTPSSRLTEILTTAGSNFRLADPGTWPEQALLAARGEWEALERLKAQLRGGVRVSSE